MTYKCVKAEDPDTDDKDLEFSIYNVTASPTGHGIDNIDEPFKLEHRTKEVDVKMNFDLQVHVKKCWELRTCTLF